MKYDFYNMLPKPSEQVDVIGQNGSGKSAWMKHLLTPYIGIRQIVLLDSKHDDIWDGFGDIYYSPDKLMRIKWPEIKVAIYRPEGDLGNDYDAYDAIFEWVYERGNTVLAVDETGKVVKNANTIKKGLDDVTTRGRKREILRMFGMQRPSGMPRVIYSETSRFYVKYVLDSRDRDTIAEFAGPYVKEEIPDQFGMKYINIKTREKMYFPNPPE